jgi:hypothetical protein
MHLQSVVFEWSKLRCEDVGELIAVRRVANFRKLVFLNLTRLVLRRLDVLLQLA